MTMQRLSLRRITLNQTRVDPAAAAPTGGRRLDSDATRCAVVAVFPSAKTLHALSARDFVEVGSVHVRFSVNRRKIRQEL